MTPAQLLNALRQTAKFIAHLRTQRLNSNPNPITANLHHPEIPTASPAYSWIGVSLNQESFNQLLTLAQQKNLTIEELIRCAITEFLKNQPQA